MSREDIHYYFTEIERLKERVKVLEAAIKAHREACGATYSSVDETLWAHLEK